MTFRTGVIQQIQLFIRKYHTFRSNLSMHALDINLLDQDTAPSRGVTRRHPPKHALHNRFILCPDEIAREPISLSEAPSGAGVFQRCVKTLEDSASNSASSDPWTSSPVS